MPLDEVDVMKAVARGLNGISSADGVARRLGYAPAKRGRLAVTARLRALERAGKVVRIPPKDQWDSAAWALTDEAKRALWKD